MNFPTNSELSTTVYIARDKDRKIVASGHSVGQVRRKLTQAGLDFSKYDIVKAEAR